MTDMILALEPLDALNGSLESLGGKGESLSKLLAAGFNVPAGFVLTTQAYRQFINSTNLQESILALVATATDKDHDALAVTTEHIRTLFNSKDLPVPIRDELMAFYRKLTNNYAEEVAVRSSANTEDLPGASFAGQHATLLNVRGESDLLAAVMQCWASLWSSQAVSYRNHMDVSHDKVAMAVVIQRMVPADVSGVLFTVNPATGDRDELLVNASYGLGETIVSGQVNPDSYLLDRDSLKVKQTRIGSKEQMLPADSREARVLRPVALPERKRSSLPARHLQHLAAQAIAVEQLSEGLSQDIEWALAGDTLWLLQARAVTNLRVRTSAENDWHAPYPGAKLIRRQVVEHIPEPLSTLFSDLYLRDGLELSFDSFLQRLQLPFDIGEVVTRPFFTTANGFAYCRADFHIPFRQIPKILVWFCREYLRKIRELTAHWQEEGFPDYLATIEHWRRVDSSQTSGTELFCGIRSLANADALYWFDVAIIVGMAKMTDGLVQFFLKVAAPGQHLTSGLFLRGFASRTIEAQLELDTIAEHIQSSVSLTELVEKTAPNELLEALHQSVDGQQVVTELQNYLKSFGHQIYSLDFVEPTQKEDPTPVLLTLRALVQGDCRAMSEQREQLLQQRQASLDELRRRFGPLRRWVFNKLLGWAEACGPGREEALFFLGAAWPVLRSLAAELGQRLVDDGVLNQPDQIYYLTKGELNAACQALDGHGSSPDFAQRASDRFALREARKALHPPAMVPIKARYKFGPFDFSFVETQKRNKPGSNSLKGFAVSPGQVTAAVSLILCVEDFHKMKPGTILVCPTTSPAWTPLFAQSVGLVTDIGGILAHGSIVAREYGIPAVMGTGNITQAVTDGQIISIDGDRGFVTIGCNRSK